MYDLRVYSQIFRPELFSYLRAEYRVWLVTAINLLLLKAL